MELYEIKKLLHNYKKMVSKLKGPPTEWEKLLLAIHQAGIHNQNIQGVHKGKTTPKLITQ
jgi:hypothetical protein